MRMIQSFDPTVAMSGTFDPQTSNACGRIMLFNESAIGLQLTFADGGNASLPAFYFRSYYVSKPGVVTWKRLYSISTGGSPLAIVIGESYESAEAKGHTFTEGPLNRQTSIGNSIPVGTSSSSIANDGNAAGASVVESTVSGDSSSAVTLTNDGHLTIGNVTHPGAVSIDNGKVYSNGAGVLAVVGQILANLINTLPNNDLTLNATTGHKIALQNNGVDVADIIGSGLTVSGVLTVSGNSELMTIDVANSQSLRWTTTGGTLKRVLVGDASNNVILQMLDNNVIVIRNVSGTEILRFNAGGIDMTQGPGNTQITTGGLTSVNAINVPAVNLTNGSFTAISKFSGTGNGTFNHNLGATPDIIVGNACTLAGSSQTIGFANYTSTQVVVTTFSGLAWQGLAIKF